MMNVGKRAGRGDLWKGQQTSISISNTTTLPLAVSSPIVLLLVPYRFPPNFAFSTNDFSSIIFSNSAMLM